MFALDTPVITLERLWCRSDVHKQSLSVGSFLGSSVHLCSTGSREQWQEESHQDGVNRLLKDRHVGKALETTWFFSHLLIFFLLGVRHYIFASRISFGAFPVKMGKLHVFGSMSLILARHFWGHCATAAHWPAAARLDSVAPRRRSSQPFLDSYPEIAWAGFGFVFLLFLFGQKQRGIFPPWKNSSVWFEKGWGQEKAGKGCLIVFLVTWLLFCTCTRLPLVRTGALLGSQNGAVGEETSSAPQSRPVFSFSLCHHFTE